jgi:hypothetical protein
MTVSVAAEELDLSRKEEFYNSRLNLLAGAAWAKDTYAVQGNY